MLSNSMGVYSALVYMNQYLERNMNEDVVRQEVHSNFSRILPSWYITINHGLPFESSWT